MNKIRTKHLDLGCGDNPRNPFLADDLYGVDIVERYDTKLQFEYKTCNLSLEKLPFLDNYFDSVSAYDLLEHIPRVHMEKGLTRFPFVELMSEIYRVLKLGGQLFALTPVYPKESAFVDPTHVNFISKGTYKYFVSPYNWAKMYGFAGSFIKIRVSVVNFEMVEKKFSIVKMAVLRFLNLVFPERKQHILWILSANKVVTK